MRISYILCASYILFSWHAITGEFVCKTQTKRVENKRFSSDIVLHLELTYLKRNPVIHPILKGISNI